MFGKIMSKKGKGFFCLFCFCFWGWGSGVLLVSHGRSFSFYFIYNDGKFLEEEMWFYFGWFFHHVLFIVIPEFLRGEQAALFFLHLNLCLKIVT
jgi:hypothetical protein